MKRSIIAVWCAALTAVPVTGRAQSQASPADRALARDIFRELIEINTTDSLGNTPRSARAMARRLLNAGFPAAVVQVLIGPDAKDCILVARYRGSRNGGGPIVG